jgi:hypothetical protein
MNGSSCSESSLAAAEPIAGTAVAETWRWLGLEYRAAWEPKAVERAELPDPAKEWLAAFQALEGTRVQLLRRPGRNGSLACFYADTTPGAQRVHRFALEQMEDLAALDLTGLVDGTAHRDARVEGPLVWVCTHGQQDRCCAQHGGRVFSALREPLGEAAWQTSHLGGHRFAATILWLPEGICYGRLGEAEAPALAAAMKCGQVYRLARFRGRTCWPRPVQAAEVALRQRLGFVTAAAPGLVGVDDGGDWTAVRFAHAGSEHDVLVRHAPLERQVPTSCGATPTSPEVFTAEHPARSE